MHPVLLAAGDWFEVVAALIFFLVTGIAQWLQKRSRARQGLPEEPSGEILQEPWSSPDQAPPPLQREERTPRGFDLEAELRRLLNPGQPEEPPPLPPSAPPRQPPRFDPEPETVSWESSEGPSHPVASLQRAEAALQRAADVESRVANRINSAGDFSAATAAIQQASKLSGQISAKLRGAHRKTPHSAPSTATLLGSRTSVAAQSLATTLRNPVSAQQALLAAMLLQPPKALEPFPPNS